MNLNAMFSLKLRVVCNYVDQNLIADQRSNFRAKYLQMVRITELKSRIISF